jgi:hypothetical protein
VLLKAEECVDKNELAGTELEEACKAQRPIYLRGRAFLLSRQRL